MRSGRRWGPMSSGRCHACDCSGELSTCWGDGARLISARPHVSRKLAADRSSEPRVEDRRSELVLEGDGWAERLDRALAGLTPSERAATVALPLEPSSAAMPIPVDQLVARLASPWFDRVVNEGRLKPHFQPIVRLEDGRVHGREALIRAEIDGRRLNGGQLVEAARAHDAIFAFDQRCRTAALEHGIPQLPDGEVLFINFNPSAIYDPDICLRTTWAVARRFDFPLSRVCFEVIESERYPDIDFLRRILDRYRAEGAMVALDDLGAGYTSLNYLRELRPDVVKLDRGLIAGIGGDRARTRLVEAIVGYAHDLGISVVAEGIETGDELRAARSLGADLAQGWWLGRPSELVEPLDPKLADLGARLSPVGAGAG